MNTPIQLSTVRRGKDIDQWHRAFYQRIPTADLIAELEADRWYAAELRQRNDDLARQTLAVLDYQIEFEIEEVEKRNRLSATGDPMCPAWPRSDETRFARVQAVKVAWPVDKFVSEVLCGDLRPAGKDMFRCLCPFHAERTPSFTVWVDEGRAWCFGQCGNGGDVIKLAGMFFGLERFYDRLEKLEDLAGIVPDRPGA